MRARGDFISSNKEGPAWVALTCPPNRTIVNFSQYQVCQLIIMTCLPIAPSLFPIIRLNRWLYFWAAEACRVWWAGSRAPPAVPLEWQH